MKTKLGIFYLVLASFSIVPSLVLAADPVSINLDIESASGTIFKGPITVTECAIDESHASTTSGYCAVEQSGVTAVWSAFGDDKFLDSVNGVANDSVAGNYWGWFANLVYGQTSLNAHLLTAGENLLVQIASVPLQVSVSTTAPTVGATTTVTVLGFGFDSSFNPVWNPATTASVIFAGETHTLNSEGKYDIIATSTAPFTLSVSGTGFITSDTITISPIAAPVVLPNPVSITLQIESGSGTIFKGPITVTACAIDGTHTATVSGYCAVEQSGVTAVWSAFGDDKFLDSINGTANDPVAGNYWGWFANLEYGQTSLNAHTLASGEHLLVNIERVPLKISVSTTTPYVGGTTTVSVLGFGFDSSFNAVWNPATTSVIKIYGVSYALDSLGKYDFTATSTDTFSVFATGTGFIDSDSLTISPNTAPAVADPTPAPTPPVPSGGGSSGVFIPTHRTFNLATALQFLESKQKSDGSFGSSLYSDWAVIALASAGDTVGRDARIQNLTTVQPALSSATDYERHAMALMSLGIDPYSGTSVNYIQKIVDYFDGTQIGDASLINDDIFALFPLLRAGYSDADSIVQKIVQNIILKQNSNGSWENSVDVTSAAIQALVLTPNLTSVNKTLALAKTYLTNSQRSDGGFGSSFSTSWAMQAVNALGDTTTNWTKGSNSPEDSLYALQQSDGGVELLTADANTRIWATSYAIPASLHKPWASILQSFPKPTVETTSTAGGSASSVAFATTSLATSTSSVQATSTIAFATTTPMATTTPDVSDDHRLILAPEGGRLDSKSETPALKSVIKPKLTPVIQKVVVKKVAPTEITPTKKPNLAIPVASVASSLPLIPNTPTARTATTLSMLAGILFLIVLL